jgi:tRNA threonylcarbamoyladenosine biosynthesis protein TsaE
MKEFVSKSREQTQKIATEFAKKLKGGEVLCFYGNLGSGKTTFIQALTKALGVKENITSPTFVLMKKYRRGAIHCAQKKGVINHAPTRCETFFYHMDAYRLGSSQEAIDLGLEEIWSDPNNIIAIEWADKITDILPKSRIDLCFAYPEYTPESKVDENERKITIF